MSLNLDTLKSEIRSYLDDNNFVTFQGMSRRLDDMREVEWDVVRYPDYRHFLDVARQLGIKLVVFHHREFSDETIDNAIESLEDAGMDYDDQRSIEQRLRELRVYDGFTCAIELSFEYTDTLYMFDLQTEWYRELNTILEEIEMSSAVEDGDEGNPLGGYYSQN
jgi:hypothetical protein